MNPPWPCNQKWASVNSPPPAGRRRSSCMSLSGAEAILKGHPLVYSLCRPPGHHAERDTYGGFCYFCNGAIAAQYLAETVGRVADPRRGLPPRQRRPGHLLQPVRRPDRLDPRPPELRLPLFLRASPTRPARARGKGFNLNLPLPEHVHDGRYLEELDEALAIVRKFKPEAPGRLARPRHRQGRPDRDLERHPDGLFEIGCRIGGLKLPTLLVQEGGYNIRSLGRNAGGHADRRLRGARSGRTARRARPNGRDPGVVRSAGGAGGRADRLRASRLTARRSTAHLTRSTYSPVRVSIRIFSPGPMNGGTWTFRPVSRVASLYWLVAVAPLIEGGVSVTVRSIEAGTSIETGLSSMYLTITLLLGRRYCIAVPRISGGKLSWS